MLATSGVPAIHHLSLPRQILIAGVGVRTILKRAYVTSNNGPPRRRPM